MAEYTVQINVKVGDHLINVNGATAEEAITNLVALADQTPLIHQALSILDGGRPATEIVQKEKTWGARSQGGRTYTNNPGAQAAPPASFPQPAQPFQGQPASPAPAGWNPQQPQWDPQQAIQQQLGATVISQTPNAPQDPVCGVHGQPLKYFGPGKNPNTQKEYAASWRCPTRGCSGTKWQKSDGSW